MVLAARAKQAFSATLPAGSGPRHAAFSGDGNFLYVLGELQSTVTVFANDARETYREIQTISTLPEGFSGRNDAAEIAIHPNGKFLYASNRGQDTIALFDIEVSPWMAATFGWLTSARARALYPVLV